MVRLAISCHYENLLQTGDVIGHGGNLVIRHAGGDGVHLRAVLAGISLGAAEHRQLGHRVVLVLAGDARILDGKTIARRAMTAGAGSNLLGSNAATVNALTQSHQGIVGCGTWGGFLRSQRTAYFPLR